MPSAPHILRSPMALGINESSRPELVDFATANLRGENIRQFRTGEASTRFGFTALTDAHTDASLPSTAYGCKMFADRNSIVRITDALTAEAYSTKSNTWASLGRVPEATARVIDLPSMGASTYQEDMEATNGYLAVGYMALRSAAVYDAYLVIIDQVTGAIVRAAEKLGTSTVSAPPVLAVQGNYFITTRYNSVGTKVEAWYLDTTSAATITTGWVPFAATLATDVGSARCILHTLPHASTPRVALLYQNSSGGADQLTLKTFNIGGVVQTLTGITLAGAPSAWTLGGNSTDTLWISWNEGNNLYVRGVSPFTISSNLAATASLITLSSSCTFVGIAASTTAGKARVWANDGAAVSQSVMRGIQTTAFTAAGDGAAVVVPGVRMSGRPTFIGGRYVSVFWNYDTGNTQNNLFVCDWTENVNFLRPIANPAPGIAVASFSSNGKIIAGTTATTYFTSFGIRRSAIADGSAILELDFANGKRWQTSVHGNSTCMAAAVPSYFDGTRVAEIGFLYRPPTPTTTTGGTGISASTGWRYVVVYEETDSDGNWHVSGLSNPSASTGVVANKTVTATTSPLAISSRMSSVAGARAVRAAWYRTLDGAVAPYYRLGSTLNDPSATTVTYVDTTTDAVLATASKLYAQPGVLGTAQDRRPPPSFSSIVSYNGMLVGASGSNVWSSAQDVIGEGTWFNPIWQVPIPGDGDITALAVMDGTLFVFKRSEVYAIVGEPPSDNGASGGLGAPRRLSCDVGCIDSRSTCTTSLAIVFQSERGLEALTPAQTVQWIGQPIQQTLASYPVVSSATVVPGPLGALILVELAASEAVGVVAGDGRTLVFDLTTNNWISTDRRKSVHSAADSPSQSACMVYTGTAWRYAWLAVTGRVHYENRSYLDADGSFVVPLIETAWFNGFQQEQCVRSATIIFQRYSAAGMKIEVAYDYATSYDVLDNCVWAESATLGQRQLELAQLNPRGETLKFRITATAPTVLGTGQGFGFIGLSLDIAPKQGAVKGTLRNDPALRR